jgi:phage regulator Rha-like protein
MKQIVKKKNESLVFDDGGSIFCDSRMVAEKFGIKHVSVSRVIESLIEKIDRIKGDPKSPLNKENPPEFYKTTEEYRGQNFTAYQMNKKAFMAVAMRFKTDSAFQYLKSEKQSTLYPSPQNPYIPLYACSVFAIPAA